MDDCIFCRIVRGEIPATVVREDEMTIAFMDIGAVNPGHVLVATKGHADDVFALSDAQAGAVMQAAAQVARALRTALEPDGLNLFQANGKAAGQTVSHFHVHLVPRWEHDGMDLVWPARNPPREELERIAGQIRAVLA